ncbi:HNH endonuclease [Sandarakinorhabdus sp.]|uniref:HNH endonuclease n=1 Tax=Sandarakinorhabdus sp. TaxID=1916663 RepID=UPI003F72C678
MGGRPEHNQHRVDAYVRMLEKIGAPASVIAKFLALVETDNWINDRGYLSSLDDLLLDACKFEGYAKPFEKNGEKRWIRPSVFEDTTEAYFPDRADDLINFDPKREQAYRRGYDQGFSAATMMVRSSKSFSEMNQMASAIRKWRFSQVFAGPTLPGEPENLAVNIVLRQSISQKLRYDVFEGDGYRCKVCGSSRDDGVKLHVDHIVAVANGGTNERSNLRTLCDQCNIGKGAR